MSGCRLPVSRVPRQLRSRMAYWHLVCRSTSIGELTRPHTRHSPLSPISTPTSSSRIFRLFNELFSRTLPVLCVSVHQHQRVSIQSSKCHYSFFPLANVLIMFQPSLRSKRPSGIWSHSLTHLRRCYCDVFGSSSTLREEDDKGFSRCCRSVITQSSYFLTAANGSLTLDPRLFYAPPIIDVMANETDGNITTVTGGTLGVFPLYLVGHIQASQLRPIAEILKITYAEANPGLNPDVVDVRLSDVNNNDSVRPSAAVAALFSSE